MADHLTFQVLERGLESEPVGGEILFGVGGGGNEFQVIIGVHRLSSCTTGRDIERNDKVDKVCQKFIGFISNKIIIKSVMKKSFEIDLDLEGP